LLHDKLFIFSFILDEAQQQQIDTAIQDVAHSPKVLFRGKLSKKWMTKFTSVIPKEEIKVFTEETAETVDVQLQVMDEQSATAVDPQMHEEMAPAVTQKEHQLTEDTATVQEHSDIPLQPEMPDFHEEMPPAVNEEQQLPEDTATGQEHSDIPLQPQMPDLHEEMPPAVNEEQQLPEDTATEHDQRDTADHQPRYILHAACLQQPQDEAHTMDSSDDFIDTSKSYTDKAFNMQCKWTFAHHEPDINQQTKLNVAQCMSLMERAEKQNMSDINKSDAIIVPMTGQVFIVHYQNEAISRMQSMRQIGHMDPYHWKNVGTHSQWAKDWRYSVTQCLHEGEKTSFKRRIYTKNEEHPKYFIIHYTGPVCDIDVPRPRLTYNKKQYHRYASIQAAKSMQITKLAELKGNQCYISKDLSLHGHIIDISITKTYCFYYIVN
jgi:hypothetical protein